MSWFRRKAKPSLTQPELDALDVVAVNLINTYWEHGYPALVVRGEGLDLSVLGPHMPSTTGHTMLTTAAEVYRLTQGLPTQQ